MSDQDDMLEDFIEGELIEEPQEGQQQQKHRSNPQPPQSHIKSYIAILVSALGGIDHSSNKDPPPYKLGVEAFLCLQDIEKWIRSYDHKENSWEVAVACAESGLLNDLITILCMWDDSLDKNTTISGYSKKNDERIAKICLRLLVLLTWPLELANNMFQRQLEHYSDLKKHQLGYKKQILSHRNGGILHAVIKIALPVIAKDKKDREKADYLVIRHCVAFFRNLLQIEPAGISKNTTKHLKQAELTENLPKGINIDDVSIGACLGAFHDNKVFKFFLTMCSSIGVGLDFEPELLVGPFQEIIYFMIRKLTPGYIMSSTCTEKDTRERTAGSMDLADMLSKEKDMINKFKKHSSSRHGRFGTLLSLQTPDMGRLTVSNAGNLLSKNNPIAAFDAHKKWHKSQKFKYLPGEEIIQPEVAIGTANRKAFHEFVCDFIDGSFNPFVKACTRVLASNIQNEGGNAEEQAKIQYLMIIAWFLEAQRERYGEHLGRVDYTLVASALSDEAFVILASFIHESLTETDKKWGLAHACMILFKEVLHVGSTLSVSSSDENRNISMNLKKRIFNDTYLDPIPAIVKGASKRSPEFVDTTIEFLDVLTKELEEYANTDMKKLIIQEKSKKYAKVYSKEQITIDELNEKDERALSKAATHLSQERRKIRDRLVGRITHPEAINTYISYIKRFEDIPEKSLKKSIKFLHKIFFTMKKHSLLYRLDFLLTLHTMLSPEGLPHNSGIRKHVEQFLTHFMKRFRRSLDKTPTLYVEMLFPLMNDKDFRFFLDTGEIFVPKEATKNEVLVNSIVEIRGSEFMDVERKVAIMVACLIDDDQRDLVEWVSEELEKIVTIRLQEKGEDIPKDKDLSEEADPDEYEDVTIRCASVTAQKKLVSEPKLRYLLKLAGVTLPSSTSDECLFSSAADVDNLITVNTYIKMYLITPVELDENKVANDFLIKRSLKNQYGGNENDGYNSEAFQDIGYASDEDDVAFGSNDEDEEGGRISFGYMDDELDKLEEAIEKNQGSLQERGIAKKKRGKVRLNKKSKKKRRYSDLPRHELSGDEHEKPRRRAEHSASYKSSRYIIDSDEDDEEADAAFFARERKLRELLERGNGSLSAAQIKNLFKSETARTADSRDDDDDMFDINPDVSKRNSPELDSPGRAGDESEKSDEIVTDYSDSHSNSEADLEDSDSHDKFSEGGEDYDAERTKATGAEDDDPLTRNHRLIPNDSDEDDDRNNEKAEGDDETIMRIPKRRLVIEDDDDE
jgi:replication fork protection complex subunit Tof1/Swi1